MKRILAILTAASIALCAFGAQAGGGRYDLVAAGITTPLTGAAQTAIDSLDGMTAVTLEAQFQYGSGGTSASAVVQTTMDNGSNWRDVARFDFTTASATKYANLSGLSAKAVTAYVALGSDSVNDGYLGNQLRVVLTTVGTYANTTLAIRASVR